MTTSHQYGLDITDHFDRIKLYKENIQEGNAKCNG